MKESGVGSWWESEGLRGDRVGSGVVKARELELGVGGEKFIQPTPKYCRLTVKI